MIITKEIILRDYNKLKQLALNAFKKDKFNDVSLYLSKAATLMYNSNIIYKDDDLEKLLYKLNTKVFTDNEKFQKIENHKKIVFYDYFVLDNRGLTEQYLEALINLNYEILFIGCHKSEKSKEIYKKLERHNIKNIVINYNDFIKKTKEIEKQIFDFSPSIILAHTSPWDIPGLVAIKHFDEKCKKYLINITDHAFWLGVTVFDYFLEFRNYGYNISNLYRGIEKKKLLLLPYYPIVNKNIPFQGFDFETEGKKIIFSGGSIYKIEGSTIFFDIVKHILLNHSDTIFLYLGNGNIDYIKKFIFENNFQKRFFYRAERKDIFEIFKHCYFYLNTYPISGGLMTQYACMAGKIPLTYRDTFDNEGNVEELFISTPNIEIQFTNLDKLKEKIDFYLDNPKVLHDDGMKLQNSIIDKTTFNSMLKNYLINSENVVSVKKYQIDTEKFSLQYVDRFNDNNETYYKLFVKRNLKTFPFFYTYYTKLLKILLWKKLKK